MTNNLQGTLEKAVLRVYGAMQKYGHEDWDGRDEEDLWHELVSCILGSKVPFEQAQAYADRVSNLKLVDVRASAFNNRDLEIKIYTVLSNPITIVRDSEAVTFRYRFPKLRASHIRKTAESIYRHDDSIHSILKRSKDPWQARVNIMMVSTGVGPKQSSLFLRNIGYADNLAILDTHVLHYMSLVGLLKASISSIPTITQYLEIEEQLRCYSSRLGVMLSYLDTAIWVTMRVYNREYAT